jgi:hypothetical protein
MAMNIRLDPRMAAALKEESHRTGESQQEIVRTAIERLLSERTLRSDRQRAIDAGLVQMGVPYKRIAGTVNMPDDFSAEDALHVVRYGSPR